METRQRPLKRDGAKGPSLVSGHQPAARARLTLTDRQEPFEKSSKGQQTA